MQSRANHLNDHSCNLAASVHRRNPAHQAIIRLVSQTENIPISQILHNSRSARASAEARKLAMYLIHVCSGLNLTETGQIFGRDRTTVRHACACVEDRRDDRKFDEKIMSLEEEISTLFQSREMLQNLQEVYQ